MPLLTETKLRQTVDLPIALPATTLKQGDWLVVSSVKLVAGQRLTLRALNLQLLESTVNTEDVGSDNKIVSNLGLAYAVLRQDYISGSPGGSGALDTLAIEAIGMESRTTVPFTATSAANYSLIVANNMQASTASDISTATSIDFKLCVTGMFRLELIGV
jgi:hypothetical protein